MAYTIYDLFTCTRWRPLNVLCFTLSMNSYTRKRMRPLNEWRTLSMIHIHVYHCDL